MLTVSVAVAVAPVPTPLPIPTIKAPEGIFTKDYRRLAWQWFWPRIIVVGQKSDYLLTTAPGGCFAEARGSKSPVVP